MLKFIAKLILLALLAYLLKDILVFLVPLPTVNMVDGFLDLQKDTDYTIFRLLRYTVWVVVLGLFFKYFGPFLNFVSPRAKRFGTTKFMRRLQGFFAEIVLFGLVYFIVGIITAAFPARADYIKTYKAQEQLLHDTVRHYQDKPSENIVEELKANQRKAREIAENIYKYNSETTFKPLFNYYQERQSLEELTDKQFYTNLKSKSEYYANNYSSESIEKQIFTNSTYKWYIQNQLSLIDKYNTAVKNEQIELNNRLYSSEMQPLYDSLSSEYTWLEFGGVTGLFYSSFGKVKWLAFFIAIILFTLLHFTNRNIVGKRLEKLIRFLEQGRFGLGGSARFAGLFEEWASLFNNQKNGLFMGRSLYNPFLNIGLEDNRHMITIAGSRAGKGTTAIIPNLLLWKGSTLVIDPKGTNAAVTARRRKALGQDVHIIDPFNVLGHRKTASFNPLEGLDPTSPNIREQVYAIAEALVIADSNQKERHWDDGAKTVIAGMIGHLISSPRYENPTLADLRTMISALPEEQTELWADMSLNEAAGRLPKDAANRIIRGINTNEISSILSNADKHTEWLSSPAMKEALGSSSFNFAELKKKPTTIYLVLPPQYLQTHNRFLRLFINMAISQMSIGGRSEVPVLLLMDEFLALGKMEEVEKAFGLMAGYNLVMWPFIQDIGRLKTLYGKSVNAFIANSRAVQVFGVADEETKEFVSKNIGERYISADLKSLQNRSIVKLRAPSEVAIDVAAETNRQYILRAGKAPLVLEKVAYYDSAPLKFLNDIDFPYKKWLGLFTGLYDQDPDYT